MPKENQEKNKFGIPNLSINTEIAISFTLFAAANIIMLTTLNTNNLLGSNAAIALLLNTLAYFFVIETIRELEEMDHFLSKRLENR